MRITGIVLAIIGSVLFIASGATAGAGPVYAMTHAAWLAVLLVGLTLIITSVIRKRSG